MQDVDSGVALISHQGEHLARRHRLVAPSPSTTVSQLLPTHLDKRRHCSTHASTTT